MMMNSKQWWESVKADPEKFNAWLVKQYRGEVTASNRIRQFSEQYATSTKDKKILGVIAQQEANHARWVLKLLETRGIVPEIANAEDRYWKETLPGIEDFETGAAVGAHAEGMRLERIRAICEDRTAPWDVRIAFLNILQDEEFHERAFTKMSTPEALEKTRHSHELGRQVLGLEA